MCGRYSLFTPIAVIEKAFAVKAVEWAEWQARYNAAPTMAMPVITNEFQQIIQFFKWGLVPKWASNTAIGAKMINTRTESIVEKPAFRNIFKYKRCLVLADGYYEWMQPMETVNAFKKIKSSKQPFRFHLPQNELMLMAGLWDTWQNQLQTFSIITCPANKDVAPFHHRMPVILTHEQAALWLRNDVPADALLSLLQPAPEGILQSYPIDTAINKALNNDPYIINPLNTLNLL